MTHETHADITIWCESSDHIEVAETGQQGTTVIRFGSWSSAFNLIGVRIFMRDIGTVAALHAKLTAHLHQHAPPHSVAANVRPATPPADPEPPEAA